jgi:chemotaxis receptor (MCP) glutamine deamidase CheD
MAQVIPQELIVGPDAYSISRDPVLLVAHLRASMAISLYDDTQGVGGLLHLRYVATLNDRPLELTDNTLSSSVLLIDRFCKEMKKAGSRAQWWRVRILAHSAMPETDVAAATVLDLVRAYFVDSTKPVNCQEFNRVAGVTVRTHAREGQIWTCGAVEDNQKVARARTG